MEGGYTVFPDLTISISPTQLTPEEEEKRRVRRERNKLAAAKCRNRRRELTDRLQAVRVVPGVGWAEGRLKGGSLSLSSAAHHHLCLCPELRARGSTCGTGYRWGQPAHTH